MDWLFVLATIGAIYSLWSMAQTLSGNKTTPTRLFLSLLSMMVVLIWASQVGGK